MPSSLLLFLVCFLQWSDALIPRKCMVTPNIEESIKTCHYCSRMVVLHVESVTEWKEIHEEAGCADNEDLDETPPGLVCASHLGTNSSGRGSDFVMYYTTRDETELIAKRCCENFDGNCNKPFQVKYPQKYMLRHIRRSPPKLMSIFVSIIVLIFYFLIRIFASRVKPMSVDVTKKEQLKMFGYRDDPLEAAIIEERTKVEEPEHAVSRANAIPNFQETLRAIFDIQYYLNGKKFDGIWMLELPRMKKDAACRGAKPPQDKAPPRILNVPERMGLPFYELKKNASKKTIFTEIIKHVTSSSTFFKTQNRPYPSGFSDFLLKLIEHGPYEYPFKAIELFEVFEKAKDQFSQDPHVLQLKNNQIVIGDIRGRYIDIFRYFNLFGWPPQRSYLFLGGIIENEEDQSLECMALLAALKSAMPTHIFILRGVGETVPYVPGRRFPGRKGESIGNSLARLCNSLPVAAVINSRILCTHSGVTTHFKGKNRLNNIQRPFNIEDMTEAGRRIIFAVPETNCRMFRMRPHEKNGEVFGMKAVQKTLSNMKLDLLIRSRSQMTEGYCLHWDNSVLSIWSAITSGTTKAAAVEVDSGCHLTLHLLDTRATLTKDKEKRVITNNVKAVEDNGDNGDEDQERDEDFARVSDKESSSRKKARKDVRGEISQGDDLPSAKAASEEGDGSKQMEVSAVRREKDTIEEKTASNKSDDKAKGEVGGASKEKTTMKDSKDSKENTGTVMADPEKEEMPKTQDSLSAKANAFSDSMLEQKTQSVKEWPAKKEGAKGVTGGKEESLKKGKKKEEEGEKEKEKVVLKTPDISIRSQHQSVLTMIDTKTPAKDEGISGKKKKIEKEENDVILKSKYEMRDAIPGDDNMSMNKKNEIQNKSEMKDLSVKKDVFEKVKLPGDSLRVDKGKKKSNETLMERMSREGARASEKEGHNKEDNAFEEKSLGSNTHKTKKVKKEEKKEEKEEKKEKKEEKEDKRKDEKEENKEKKEEKEEKRKDEK